jgi:hypothetical protein
MKMRRWILIVLGGLAASVILSALWTQQLERHDIRFAIKLNTRHNEIRLGLSPGYYWFRFDHQGNVGIAATTFERLEGVTLRTVVSSSTNTVLLDTARGFGSFRIVRRSAIPVVVTVDSESSSEKPVYFCFSRGK